MGKERYKDQYEPQIEEDYNSWVHYRPGNLENIKKWSLFQMFQGYLSRPWPSILELKVPHRSKTQVFHPASAASNLIPNIHSCKNMELKRLIL